MFISNLSCAHLDLNIPKTWKHLKAWEHNWEHIVVLCITNDIPPYGFLCENDSGGDSTASARSWPGLKTSFRCMVYPSILIYDISIYFTVICSLSDCKRSCSVWKSPPLILSTLPETRTLTQDFGSRVAFPLRCPPHVDIWGPKPWNLQISWTSDSAFNIGWGFSSESTEKW